MWKKFRFYYWLVTGFVKKHKLVLFPAAVVGALTFFQLPRLLAFMPEAQETVYIGRVGNYVWPTNVPRDIQTKISQGLTAIDSTGDVVPALARDWQVLDEGTTYVFTLADDIYWQDGTPVTAYDVDYRINDVTIDIRDEKTVVFTLAEPFAPFPSILSQPLFKSTEINYFQVVTRDKVLGTGDYSLTKLELEADGSIESMTLENDVQKIIYRFYDTETAAIMAFKLAEIDVVENLSGPTDLASWPTVSVEIDTDRHDYVTMFFNVEDANLNDKKIRQALTYLIPKPEGESLRALSPLSPESWAHNPNVKPYNYSLETAQELVIGLKMDFELELSTTPTFFAMAEEIQRSWEQLGITVKLNVVNLPDTNNYQALLIGQRIPQDPDQYILWHSTQESNITNYQSAKIDKLLEDGRKEIDKDSRREIYLDFQRFLVEDSPAAFIRYLESYTIRRK